MLDLFQNKKLCTGPLTKPQVCRVDVAYIRDGVSLYAEWRDTKFVTYMSTEFPGHSEHER